jgi:hypothetical protein
VEILVPLDMPLLFIPRAKEDKQDRYRAASERQFSERRGCEGGKKGETKRETSKRERETSHHDTRLLWSEESKQERDLRAEPRERQTDRKVWSRHTIE